MNNTIFKIAAIAIITISHSIWFGEKANAQVDLSSKGIPIKISSPAGATVNNGMGMAEMDGVKTINYEVKKGSFILDVSMDDEDMWQEPSEYLSDAKEFASEEEGFELISEEANGFIYKLSIDGDPDYNFYYLKTKNNRAIEFEAGLNMTAEFTLDQVKRMFTVAKGAM
jgi:hypothetical protein